MAWISLTEADVQGRLTGPELAALKTAALSAGQSGSAILAAAIASVVGEVRGYVAACKDNVLGEAGTIPEELTSTALALIRRYLFTRLPGMKGLYDQIRQDETKEAIKRLEDTARCMFSIVPPVQPAPEAEQVGAPGPSVGCRPHQFSRRNGDGL